MSLSPNLNDPSAVAALIDHTALKPDVSEPQIAQLCAEALRWKFASVCVNPYWVLLCAGELKNTPVRVCTVIGFPLGATTESAKLAEAEIALRQGAHELDMVQNIGALRSQHLDTIKAEIAHLAALAHSNDAILKVILETCLLSQEEKVTAARLAVDAGADFVKTSTGFSSGGATVEDVSLLRETVGAHTGVKASGGIKTLQTLRNMVNAGATRIGTSSGVTILQEFEEGRQNEPAPMADRSGTPY